MADIIYRGVNCFEIKTKKANIIIDPFSKEYGKQPSIKDKIVLYTSRTAVELDDSARFVISNPGEYEIDLVSIAGIPTKAYGDDSSETGATIYRLVIGDTRLGVIGNIEPKLSDEQLEALGLIDYLIIPVGGNGLTIDSTAAASLVRDIEPKIIIPSHYAADGITFPVAQDKIDAFGKELGKEVVIEQKIKLSRNDLPEELSIIGLAIS